MLIPVILSGGSGTRLWPVSREHYPKQLLALAGRGETMLQATILRTMSLERIGPPIVVCNEGHRFLVAEQLRQLGVTNVEIILESVGRNTAPAIAMAALAALKRSSSEQVSLLVLPADHLIANEAGFCTAVNGAVSLVQTDRVVTFGIVPTSPATGYGYILRGESLVSGRNNAYRLARFVEKPSRSVAESLIASGECYWNSGIYLLSARGYLTELQQHATDIHDACMRSWEGRSADSDFIRPDTASFVACRADSIDYAVMEKSSTAAVVPLDAGWSDVGSWSSLHEVLERDPDGNAFRGDVIAEDTHDSLIVAQNRLVAAVGLRGCVVVETKDAVLVVPKDRVQDVKLLVNRLRAADRSEHALHREVHRPWGSYDSIEQGLGYQVKRITVNAGAAISLQLHHHRSEHWIVVSGRARVTRGEDTFELEPNQSTYIPIGIKHRMENIGSEPLQIIEVQSGSYLGEDDIVRFDDRYGRVGGSS